jgi:hypothetical protein
LQSLIVAIREKEGLNILIGGVQDVRGAIPIGEKNLPLGVKTRFVLDQLGQAYPVARRQAVILEYPGHG